MDKSLIWLWLSLHFGEGTRIYNDLLAYFGTEEKIYDCDDSDIEMCDWLSDTQKSKLLDKNLNHAYEIEQWCEDNGVRLITYADGIYPDTLRLLDDFPAVLYCLGEFPDLRNKVIIGIVGTRRMSVRGEKMAYSLGYSLAKGGAITVSGMALGIDGTSQMGTLAAGGTTIAVLGSGINIVYPKHNEELYQAIIYSGAVITEYPPNTPPNARNFPVRNRLISGLSLGVVVVEGDENSGSMITARRAIKQERDLFAVPGPAGEFLSSGPNKLIKEGAIVCENAIDIFENYLEHYRDSINLVAAKLLPRSRREIYSVASTINEGRFYMRGSEEENLKPKRHLPTFRRKKEQPIEKRAEVDLSILSENDKMVYTAMELGKMVTEDNFLSLGLSVSDISTAFLNLEIYGFIEAKPGGFYVKK